MKERLARWWLAWLLVFCAPAAAGVVDDGEPVDITFAGSATRGNFAAIGELLGEMLRREYPGSSFTYEPGSMAATITRMADGSYPLGVSGAVEMALAERGEPPYRRAYRPTEFPVVALIIKEMQAFVIARRDYLERHRITSLAEFSEHQLAGRVVVGQRGNLSAYSQTLSILRAYGVTPERIESWGGQVLYFSTRRGLEMMRDDRADILLSGAFHPDSRILELQRAVDVVFMPLDEPVVASLVREFDAERAVIAARSYSFLDRDYPSLSPGLFILASPHGSDEAVYKMVKALHRHFHLLRAVHPALRELGPQMLPQVGGRPLHPAAAQYYREVGLLDDS